MNQTCKQCGAEFEPAVLEFGGKVMVTKLYCDDCCQKGQAKNPEPSRDDFFKRLCPAIYLETDPMRLTGKFVSEVLAWEYGPRGLVVVGKTGVGKSRAVWLMLRRIHREGYRIVATDGFKFRASMARAAADNNKEWWLECLGKVDVWFFDDLGQMKVTEAAGEALLAVVEKRTANKKPILVTTNYGQAAFAAQFERPEMGIAIQRRIREFCHAIEAKP